MKKFTLFFAALFLLQVAQAQKGLEAGLNFVPGNTWIINDEDFADGDRLDFRGTFGYNAGLTLGYNFSETFGISTGALISRQGQNYTTGFENVAKDEQDFYSRQLNYVRIPIMLKMSGDPSKGASAFVRVGPHIDFLTGATYNYDYAQVIGSGRSTGSVNLRDHQGYEIYRSMLIGATLEMGSRIRISDNFGIILALNLSGSFNVEGADANRMGNNPAQALLQNARIPRPYFPTNNGVRGNTFNVMGGITIGVNYVVSFD